MTTVKEMLAARPQGMPEVPPGPEMWCGSTEQRPMPRKRNKLSLAKRLRKLAKERRPVSFVVYAPGTEHDRPVHAVYMRDFKVRRTQDGHHVIVGRDIEHEEKRQLELSGELGRTTSRRKYTARSKREKVFRQYRVDRILYNTLIHG